MTRHVRFEDEANAEYREAGRWYESRREGLGIVFFDAVDAALSQILDFPSRCHHAARRYEVARYY